MYYTDAQTGKRLRKNYIKKPEINRVVKSD